MKSRAIYLLLFLGISTVLWGQNQGNIWYFGEGIGLDFNGGNPVPLYDGEIFGNPQQSDEFIYNEGSSTISDANGNLLFYTEGERVWNRDHKLMPNGTGLAGMYSATHPAFIVPRPLSDSIFYIFTTDGLERRLEGGLRYSVVDMCLEGGLGDVVVGQKNILLLDTVAEKLSAVNHVNGKDIWLIAHKMFSDAFYAYRISENGIVETVISNIGSVHVGDLGFLDGAGGAIGQMKTSPDGRRLALVVGNRNPHIAELFDFDPATGIVSDFISLDTENLCYGIEFSPDNSKLYINGLLGLHQFDLSAGSGTEAEINATKTQIVSGGCLPAGMQLGPNGRIYISRCGNTIAAIRRPNFAGAACVYQAQEITLTFNRTTGSSFPSFISSFVYSNGINSCGFAAENDPIACSDGLDNDGDGLIDCLDEDCAGIYPIGCATCFNDGLSFADSVIAYNPECPSNNNTDPSQALGVADYMTPTGPEFVSLGEGGVLVLGFTNNIVVNSGNADPDIWVFEVGPAIEPTDVSLRPANGITISRLLSAGISDSDGDGFYEFGTLMGATASLDIDFLAAGFAFAELKFDAIKIVDIVDRVCTDATPGADIDAVCALSSITCTAVELTNEQVRLCSGESYAGYNSTGIYRDTLVNALGCDSVRVLDLEVSELEIFDIVTMQANCGVANGSINISAGNGIGILRYSIDGINFQTTGFFPDLLIGTYSVTIRDANDCEVSDQAIITGVNSPVVTNTQIDSTTCGNNNGRIEVIATGGTAPLRYSLSGGADQATGEFNNLAAGAYLVQVRDASDCELNLPLEVVAKPIPQIIDLAVGQPSCGLDNGSIQILTVGGDAIRYSLNGQDFQLLDSFSNLAPGSYTVFIEDIDACVDQRDAILDANEAPQIISLATTVASCGLANGMVEIEAIGGVGTILYSIYDAGIYC